MRKRGKLPRADVPGQIKHSFAAPLAFQKVLMSVQDNCFFDILLRVFGEARKFHGHPSQVAEHPSNDHLTLSVIPIRKGNAQVDFRSPAQSREQRVKEMHDGHSETSRQGLWKKPQALYEEPHRRIFEPL